ncbi:MAG: 50S ribosomal protein L11 methyltransferase [Deltaproteobacteria bacterium]|nr:50S ribosomal protein L11 methyltransferase [Deltaproteobacteria bacterium]
MPAIYGYGDPGNHATMLVDAVRMRAFAEAIRRAVRPDDVVVDVGSGTGVLALLAAKAGARRVYAIEAGPMARVIEREAAGNGVADVVRVVRADARDVRFEGELADKPTLIVSEMIGSFGLDEDYLGLLGAVRARCAPGCRVLPGSVAIHLALASLPSLAEELATVRGGLGVRLDEVANLLQSRPCMAWVNGTELLTSSTPAQRFSVGDPTPRAVGGPTTAQRSGSANAIVGWFESELVPGVSLSSSPDGRPTHWAHLVFPLDPPLALAVDDTVDLEVRPRVITERSTWSWSARVGDTRRAGDAMRSLAGNKDDLLRSLGVRVTTPDPHSSAQLARWAAALAGGVAAVSVMAQRLRAACPDRYADDDDAAKEVERLVTLADL